MVTIEIKAFPKAKRQAVKKEGDMYKVYVSAPAEDGKANDAVVALLSEYFKVKRGHIKIIKGLKSRYKTITIWGVLSP